MKMLVQRTPISMATPFILSELREFVRIDGADDDATLQKMASEAAAEVEHLAQVALLTQTIRVTILDLVLGSDLSMPIGPVSEGISASVLVDGASLIGCEIIAGTRPVLILPEVVRGKSAARVVIEYEAGFGSTAGDIPPDLAQAVLDQVALTFDGRGLQDTKAPIRSPHLARVTARYRRVAL